MAAVVQLHRAVQGVRPVQGLLVLDEGLPGVGIGGQVDHHGGGARCAVLHFGGYPVPREGRVPDGAGRGAGQGQVEAVLAGVDHEVPGCVDE
ncbi:hypothetical protein ABIE67_010316 [Streptomyces sp. V4I8]|uniref:hypothetical protein n=1 Tax=Streptomyces sp. V4I8 TaxID=3156469 RepID=UPI0035142F72